MRVYSENLYLFANKCQKYLKEILEKECQLEVRRSRFLLNRYTYPLHVVMFEGESKLGYFDPHTYQIGLNSSLIYNVKENVLKDILRHELAHYLQFIETQTTTLPHGPEFLAICERYGWDRSISKSTINVDLANVEKIGNLEMEKLMQKVKALLSLATSDNEHEAQLATMKANELLYKYNIKHFDFGLDKKIYTKELITAKRKNAKLSCIYDILKTFLVRPILVYGKGKVMLEASGTKESLELADYVTKYLDDELDRLWSHKNELKGQRAKNSFFLGIAKGYEQKMQEYQSSMDANDEKALMRINANLDESMAKIYRRLSHTSSQGSRDHAAFASGVNAGNKLTIQSVLKNKNTNNTKKISWRSYE